MITHLSATTTARIVSELLEHSGSAGASRVLTLVIPTDAAGLEEALYAAHGASRDHPCRVIAVVAPGAEDHPGEHEADSHGHLDAEIRVGHHAGAGGNPGVAPVG